ncbi:MAG: XisH family protein [Chloroflexales bacterium]|nr:XisH family protein [Chloroflexales bacterium]
MAARDIFHNAVKAALQKEGWTITHDPLPRLYGGIDLYIDPGAERILAAERGDERIAVEVKSFLATSLVSEFHTALGQFLNYRLVLEEQDPERELFLAVPFDTYNLFFTQPFPQLAIQRHHVKLIVYDAEQEEITLWQS